MKPIGRTTLAVAVQLALLTLATPAIAKSQDSTTDQSKVEKKQQMVVVAAKQTLQAPGVSIITQDDLEKTPPARDLSEIIRTMPGVNLTGNSTSGQRGNNRQIDIRGMGPENTMILVDGMPVKSRNSVRYGWRGERDTRGDTGWVPPEMVDHIEVIRGPAAARYGSGAEGGVINIVTKSPTKKWHGSWNTYMNAPQHSKEGSSRRTNVSLNGPLSDSLFLQLYAGYSKTKPDARDINAGHTTERTGTYADEYPAGREGVVDKDLHSKLRWDVTENQHLEFSVDYSRQGNLYAGDTQNTNSNTLVEEEYGDETNRLYRQQYAVHWTGGWANGITTNNYVQYEYTRNSRINEGLAGGTEGIFDTTNEGFSTIALRNWTLHSEVDVPFKAWVNQTMTAGAEYVHEHMNDPISTSQSLYAAYGDIDGVSSDRSPFSSDEIYSLFLEDNIALTDSTMLTPGLRYDHHSFSGDNWSPSLNLSQELGSDFTLKMGIARAYKAPNLYQTNANYLLFSKGNGCYDSSDACYLMGNPNLKAENSVNKELGIEYDHNGYQAGLTWFRNDYHNKIQAGTTPVGTTSTDAANIYQWTNISRAVVEGLEGTVNVPLSRDLSLKNNLTYMIQNKNKDTGDYLSVIPRFTINSKLGWQATDSLFLQSTMTWYGRQKPRKYDYQGEPAEGSEKNEVAPYAIFGFSGTYEVNKYVSFTAGVSNLFDKRQYREGNALTVTNSRTNDYMSGAGAQTYNESGRTFYASLNTHF
ncbi:TonB-dependent siderophore receptor [Celerinatantimonas sp. MCCC 1A17872]|uniref:TonB-dependent siderophore receptor n=1 Tax=Celerinatantimonas sp. MCCC 1A17872 TaxID=3177514 RepID=UPI0038C0CD3E